MLQKCNPSQEISTLTSEHLWWTCLLYRPCHAECIFAEPLQMSHACQRFSNCCKTRTFCSLLTRCTIPCVCRAKRHLNVQKCSEREIFFAFSLANVLRATTACTFSTSQLKKKVRGWGALYILIHFDLDMCFARQRRALFRHHNFKKCSKAEVLCTFSLGNVLLATTACTFSTAQHPKVLWTYQFLTLLTWKCASRHNGAQFFISHLASWLRTRRFSEPTFRPCGATNHWKNTVFRDFPTFSRTWIFFLLRRSLFWSWLFTSLLFICPYCRKFDF